MGHVERLASIHVIAHVLMIASHVIVRRVHEILLGVLRAIVCGALLGRGRVRWQHLVRWHGAIWHRLWWGERAIGNVWNVRRESGTRTKLSGKRQVCLKLRWDSLTSVRRMA